MRSDEEMMREQMLEDPMPREGFVPGDTVIINVDVYGLWGRDPHPPVRRYGPGSGRMPDSPCWIGVVAYQDKEGEAIGRRLAGPGQPPIDFYYVATNAGFYVFAYYELQHAELGNIGNLKEPHCIARLRHTS